MSDNEEPSDEEQRLIKEIDKEIDKRVKNDHRIKFSNLSNWKEEA